MSSTLVYDAIKARLVDQLGGTYAIRDFEEIETQLQQATDPWIALEDSGGGNTLNSVGSPQSNWVTDDGYIDAHIFVPSTGSLALARTISEQVRDVLLYYQMTVTDGYVRSLSVDPPSVGFMHDGLWHNMFVSINYTHQYARATVA